MKNTIAILALLVSFNVTADIDINRNCASQYQPILDSNNDDDEAIAFFLLNAIVESDRIYAESLFPALAKNEVYAFKYASRFAKECLSSGLSVKNVVSKMLNLNEF